MVVIFLILLIILVLLLVCNKTRETFINITNTRINALHTVFILKENIVFLEEWIDYHKEIGFNKFYLYDNTGSIGRGNSTKSKNKYNFNFDKIIKLSDKEIQSHLDNILKKYPEITYIKWQPKDEEGNIIYGYMPSIYHYFKNFKNESDWTAFTDIDEFIYLNNDINTFLNGIDKNISQVSMKQIKMEDRFCSNKHNILEIDNSLEVDTTSWAYKNIMKNSSIILDEFWKKNKNKNMHDMRTDIGERKLFSPEEIVFYHYNVNAKQVEWMNKNNKKFKITKNKKLNDISKKINKDYNNKLINFDYINKNYKKLCYF